MGFRVAPALAGLGGALLVTLLLSPKGCTDSIPPVCSSAFGYSVPGGSWWIPAAITVGLLAYVLVSWAARGSRTR